MDRPTQERRSIFVTANALFAWACVSWLGYLVLSHRVFPASPDSSLVENPFPYYGAVVSSLGWGILVALFGAPNWARMSLAARVAVFGPLALAAAFASIWYFRA
jgi:hypothetical protein